MKKDKKISLEVVEAKKDSVGKNVVLVSSEELDTLGMVSGDIVRLIGEKELYFRAVRSEVASGTIGLDGAIRSVLGTSVGERIQLAPVESLPSLKSVTLSILPQDKFSNDQLKSFSSQLMEGGLFSKFTLHIPLTVGQKISIPTNVGTLTYVVSATLPKKQASGMVTEQTKIDVSSEVGEGSGTNIYYEDIGGLKEEVEKIREMVEFPMKHPDIFQRLGISAPKGVLLTGPPGTGKTLLAKAVATETDARFISIAGPEIMSKYHGGSEENLRSKFEEAEKHSPSIIFIDEIDAIAPKRGESHDQAEKRVVTQLLTLMDGLKSRGQVVVMAATNRPDDLDEALRRPGRFDRELKINPPTEEGRKEILRIHSRNMPIEHRDAVLDEVSKKTLGYTGADIEVLCKEAALRAVKPFYKELVNIGEEEAELPEGKEHSALELRKQELLQNVQVRQEHFDYAMKIVEPSAMREVLIKKPNVKWDDVGGLKEAKEKLRELVELPLLRPELYDAAGIKPSKGVLLSGPSGTGKTLLAKAVATEANANFISVKGPELISKWVGESEKHVREIFKKAKQVSPSIIFFDEFDSISKARGSGMGNDASEKVVNQLLTELDGIEDLENVMIIAATNRADLIDPAILRPGRIDARVELGIPDTETRREIFSVHTRRMPLEKGIDLDYYVSVTDDFSGAEIEAICRNAGISAIKRHYTEKDLSKVKITKKDFDYGLSEVKKSRKTDVKEESPGMPDMAELMKQMPSQDLSSPKKASVKKKVSKKAKKN